MHRGPKTRSVPPTGYLDYAQLVKIYGAAAESAFAECHNLTMRMQMRRISRTECRKQKAIARAREWAIR